MERKLVKLSRGKLETIAVTDKPLTWLDQLRVYYAKAIVILNAVLIIGNEIAPVIPDAQRQYVTTALATITVVVAVLNRNKAWIENVTT